MKNETKVNQIAILITSLLFGLWTLGVSDYKWACLIFALNTVLWEVAYLMYKLDKGFNMKGQNNWGSKAVVVFLVIGLGVIGNGLMNTSEATSDAENEPVSEETTEVELIYDDSVEGQIRAIADEHNFQWPDYLVRLADCESRLNPYATNGNGGHSIDRGLFQINDYYHPEVSDECAFSLRCSTEWTMGMINDGNQNQWTCDKLIK